VTRARARDRRVYLAGHPVLFAVLGATRRRPVVRLGRTVLVHDRAAYVTALTKIPLDRTAPGTTGGEAGRLAGEAVLFDEQGASHRQSRRDVASRFGSAAVARLRPVWMAVLQRRLDPLVLGRPVDIVPLALEVSGTTAAELLGLGGRVDPVELARAARAAADLAARAHLPGPGRRRATRQAPAAAARLSALVAGGPLPVGMATTLAAAAVSTTVAALPRAVAWACDAGLWDAVPSRVDALTDELLRVVAPTPLLPRVVAQTKQIGQARRPLPQPVLGGPSMAGDADNFPSLSTGCPVHAGDRLLLVARHAVDAHCADPDPAHPAPAHIAQLVFGTGPHVCPGARLARRQLADLLTALAPYRPRVRTARADRHAALPSWRTLVVEP
jgi:cytochrome P450